jgi:hypothetical protein
MNDPSTRLEQSTEPAAGQGSVNKATSSPEETVHFGTPRNDGLHHLAASHRPAAAAAAWEAIDRVFADLDN